MAKQTMMPDKSLVLPGRPGNPAKSYLIVRDDGFTGKDKYVRFWRGRGVLDLLAIHLERPDWVVNEGGAYVQMTGVALSEYVDYWERRRFEVAEISATKAAKFRAEADEERRQAEAIELAKQRGRQKAKSLDKEAESQDFEAAAEEEAKQKLGFRDVPPPVAESATNDAPDTTEILPHERLAAADAVSPQEYPNDPLHLRPSKSGAGG